MRTTIKDIAKRVGVSTSLVSMHLNKHPLSERIADETKKRIDEAVREMNYRPSATALSLRKGKSKTIGLVIGRIYSVYSSFYAEALMHEVEKYGYQLLISVTRFDKENERKCLNNLYNRQTDGILYSLHIDSREPVPPFLTNYPLLITHYPHPELNTILLDETEPINEVCSLMKERGFKKLFSTFLCDKKSFKGSCGVELCCQPRRNFKTNRELLEAVKAENAEVLEFGSSVLAMDFLNDLREEKDLPYIIFPYSLPSDYFEHPKVLGAIVNNFQELVALQVKRIIEMIEKPQNKISHIAIPTKFLSPAELNGRYQEQLSDEYYQGIVSELSIAARRW